MSSIILIFRDEYNVNLYGVDEDGELSGVEEMKAEIYARWDIYVYKSISI